MGECGKEDTYAHYKMLYAPPTEGIMANIEFDILENAVDSLNEALTKYQEGKAGNPKAYKFCVQHLSHFLELILKYYVTLSHPLLIYKNPFAKSIGSDSQTIGLQEAISFLKNEGKLVDGKFEDDLYWLKKLRNSIEHHKFSMNAEEVEETIGRLMSAIANFDEAHEKIEVDQYLAADQFEIFHELAKTYEKALKKAEAEIEDFFRGIAPGEPVEAHVYHCDECDHDTMIPNGESSTGYRCTFCGNEESGEIEVNCGMCGLNWPTWQMKIIDWTDTGNEEYYCPRCLHHPDYVRDD